MTDSPVTWVIDALEVITALGIAAYWIMWFRTPHDEPWLPDGYVEREAPFVFTDMILAIVLVVAAVLQVTDEPPTSAAVLVSGGRPAGESLGLIAAGLPTTLNFSMDLGTRKGVWQKHRRRQIG